MKQDEIHNNFHSLNRVPFLTNIISVFPSAKHVPYFASRKTANHISQKCAEAVQASFARTGGSSLASESCTIRKSWKKIQLPFITCNSANYERHFHNNGQAHTLILNLPFTGKCQRRFDPHDQSNNIHEHSPTEAPQLHVEEPRSLDSIYIQTYIYLNSRQSINMLLSK